MILKKISLHPFAGLDNSEVSFAPGLNVICGPNEAGKSTIVKALQELLFRKTRLNKREWTEIEKLYLPVTGGNIISASVDFDADGKSISLSKSWGASPECRLKEFPGSVFSGDNEIETRLTNYLGFNEATYRNIFMISQMMLGETIERLNSEPDSVRNLEQILRNINSITDGVSVTALRENLEQIINAGYFARWDREKNRPKDGRDYDNPWISGVGRVTLDYYAVRKLEEELRSSLHYEISLDKLHKSYGKVECEIKQLDDFLTGFNTAYEGALKRGQLQEKKKRIEGECKTLKSVLSEWMKIDERKNNFEALIKELELKQVNLFSEKQLAEKHAGQQSLRETYGKSAAVKELLDEKKKEQSLRLFVAADQVKLAESYKKKIDEVRIRMEGQKLSLRLFAKSALQFKSGSLPDKMEIENLEAGETINRSYSGQVMYEDDRIKFLLQPGTADINSLLKIKNENENNLKACLSGFGAVDLEELKQKETEYSKAAQEIKLIEGKLSVLLGRYSSFDELQALHSSLEDIPLPRPVANITEELIEVSSSLKSKQDGLTAINNNIAEWTKVYSDINNLMEMIGEKTIELKQAEKELSLSGSIPPGYSDEQEFITVYRKNLQLRNEKESEMNSLNVQKAELIARQPQRNAADIKELLDEAKNKFSMAQKEAQAYLTINNKLNSILSELSDNPYEPLQQEIASLLCSLTNGRYAKIEMNESITTSICSNGKKLDLNHLSAGTKDILALAVRLAMAEFLLKAQSGFLIMDDPLINLDPPRKASAVELIKNLASDQRQIIILTCDPGNAGLFSDNIIYLNR